MKKIIIMAFAATLMALAACEKIHADQRVKTTDIERVSANHNDKKSFDDEVKVYVQLMTDFVEFSKIDKLILENLALTGRLDNHRALASKLNDACGKFMKSATILKQLYDIKDTDEFESTEWVFEYNNMIKAWNKYAKVHNQWVKLVN